MSLRLGISMRVVSNETYPEERDSLSRDWSAYLSRVLPGVTLVPLLNQPDAVIPLVTSLKLQGIILSGGNNLGEFPRRDATEKKLLSFAVAHRLPVLGVCRGLQLLNVFFGGTLSKEIHKKSLENHRNTLHPIQLVSHTPMAKLSRLATLRVNSFHDQGVMEAELARALRVFAKTAGGVVEGLYHPKKPIVGIEWHPERKSPSRAFDRRLLEYLFTHAR